jgi:hypothetical protein
MATAALIIGLTRQGVGTRGAAYPRFSTPIDWASVIKCATDHRVAPLVWQALAGIPAGMVPAPVLASFEAAMWRSSAGRMICEHTLRALLDLLDTYAIEVLVLKGASLAHTVYPRPELRPYHDLDILCRPADYSRLATALCSAGYQQAEHGGTTRGRRGYQGSRRHAFFAPSGHVEIEIHLDVLGLGLAERSQGAFWRAAQVVEAGDLRMHMLAPMHQLVHLAVHVHAHCYSRLLWLVDLDLLIRRHWHSLDWEHVLRIARAEGVGTVLRHALATAHAVLGTPLPPLPPPTLEERCLGVIYRQLWPLRQVQRLERREHRRLLRFAPDSGDPRDVVYSLMLLGHRREKWRSLLGYWSCLHGSRVRQQSMVRRRWRWRHMQPAVPPGC